MFSSMTEQSQAINDEHEHVALTLFGATSIWDQAKIHPRRLGLTILKSVIMEQNKIDFSGPQQMKLFQHIHTANKIITINSS